MDIIKAHIFSIRHRASILKSTNRGCFCCLEIFLPNKIKDWCDTRNETKEQTALCPKCGIDSVIGDFDVNFDKQFLKKMKEHWF